MAQEEERRGEEVKTVFVRGLPFTLSDAQLEEAFSEIGPVRRAFTVKERATNKHRGYGYVQYALAEDAQRAAELKNGILLEGRKIKVEVAKRRAPLSERKKKKSGGDPTPAATEKETERNTEKRTGKRERSKYEKQQENNAESRVMKNKKRKLSQPATTDDSKVSQKQKPARTVVIGNLTDVEPVLALMQKLGTVESFEKSLTDDYLKAYGLLRDGCKQSAILVVFTSVRAARETVSTFHNQKLGNDLVWTRQLGGEGAKLKKWRLIVRNLPFKVTEEMLREAFSAAGFLWEITIPRKPDGQSKGFAFIGFTSKSDAEKAIKNVNGKKIAKRTVAVDWAVAKEKYENIKSTENESEESEDTASEAECDDGNSDTDNESNGEHVENEQSDELSLVHKVLEKVVTADADQSGKPDFAHANREKRTEPDKPGSSHGKAEKRDTKVDFAKTSFQDETRSEPDDVLQRTVFVRNLPQDSRVNELRNRFSEFGDVNSFRLVLNRSTGKPKGTAFVEFATREGAKAVVKAAEGAEEGSSELVISGQRTIVHFAVEKDAAKRISVKKSNEKDHDRRNLNLLKEGLIEPGSRAAEDVSKSDLQKREALQNEKNIKLRSPNFHVSTTRLAIHNFPKSLDEKQIKQLFIKAVVSRAAKQRPVVKQVKLLTDDKGSSRGSGFVEFTEHQHALVALRVLNNNPETFGPEKRPIVEFAIDNVAKLKKREERLAAHKSGQKPQKVKHTEHTDNANDVPAKLKRKRTPENDNTVEDQSKKASRRKRKRAESNATDDKRIKQRQANKENGVKQQQTKSPKVQDDGKRKKNKHRKTENEVEDDLDKLVKEYKTKFFDTRKPEAKSKTLENIKRWFE